MQQTPPLMRDETKARRRWSRKQQNENMRGAKGVDKDDRSQEKDSFDAQFSGYTEYKRKLVS